MTKAKGIVKSHFWGVHSSEWEIWGDRLIEEVIEEVSQWLEWQKMSQPGDDQEEESSPMERPCDRKVLSIFEHEDGPVRGVRQEVTQR